MEKGEDERSFFSALWIAQFAPTLQELTIGFGDLCHDDHASWTEYELDAIFSGETEERISQVSDSGNYKEYLEEKAVLIGEQQQQPPPPSILNFKSKKSTKTKLCDLILKKNIF